LVSRPLGIGYPVNLGVITTAAGAAAGAVGQLLVVGSKVMVTWPSPVRLLGPEDKLVAVTKTCDEPPPPPASDPFPAPPAP
jgi:hypothetical protein